MEVNFEMKKRLMSLFMCAVMLLSAFAFGACSDNTELPEPEEDITTINIYGIKEPGTTDASIEAVEAALSQISYRKHETKVNLVLFEEKDYASFIFAKVRDEMRKNGTDVDYSSDKINVANRLNAEASSSSMDIFLVYTPKAGSETLNKESDYYSAGLANGGMFEILYNKQALLGLNKYLNNANYKILATNAYEDALNAVKRVSYGSLKKEESELKESDYDRFGVPNNIVYGGYEFYVLNKAYFEEYYPGIDYKEFFALSEGGNQAFETAIEELRRKKDSLEIPADVEIVKEFASYDELNAYTHEGKDFCVAKVTGSIAIKELCEESGKFNVYETKVSLINSADLYESMFCISSTLTNEERIKDALDILILLNTNAEFRNIYQYGVKDTHYTLGRDGIAYVGAVGSKNVYKMNPLYCGNMFIAYPSDNMSAEMRKLAENEWDLAQKQVDDVLRRYKLK